MSSRSRTILIALALSAVLSALGTPLMANVTGRPHDLSRSNPKGHCLNCHDLHQTKLGQGYAHNLKRANEIEVCYQCHAGSQNNYSSIDPSYKNITGLYSHYDIRSEFNQPNIHFPRYGMDGEKNKCSECHNPHGVFDHTSTTRKPKLISAGPDAVTDTDEFCFVCHNNDQNPPHQKFSNISVGSQYRFSRTNYKQMTHSTFYRATTVTEPVPDTARTYDDNPYGKGKDISCLTCHRPHGTANSYMLKAPDNQDLCLTCHNGTKAPDLTSFKTTGHGKSGTGRICQDCHFPHGTGQENAIKKTITDPHNGAGNTADVNGSGMNEACFACHASGGTATASYSFDSSLSGWYGNIVSPARDTGTYYLGGASMKLSAASAANAYAYTDLITVQPNTAYTVMAFLNLPANLTGGSSYITVAECNSVGNVVRNSSSTGKSSQMSRWERQMLSFTTTASTASIRIYIYHTGAGTAYWDEVQLMGASDKTYYLGKSAYNSGVHKTGAAAHNPKDTVSDQAAGDCDNCHNPHGKGYSKMTLDPDDQTLCYDCHNAGTPNTKSGRDVQATFQMSSHHDLGKVRCVGCHNVHKVTQSQSMTDPYNGGVLMGDKTVFCLSCHSGVMPSGVTGAPNTNAEWSGGGHDATHILGCADCHDSHGSPNPNNLNYGVKSYSGYTANFAAGMSFASRSFCEACHNRTGLGYKGAKKIPTGAGYVGQHDQSDITSCSNCHTKKHNPTVGNYTGSASFYTSACLDCHTQGKGNPYPNADAEFNTPGNQSDANTRKSIHDITYSPPATVDCVTCHGSNHETDHSGTRKVKDPDPFNGKTGIMPGIQTSSVFCLECHDGTPVSIGGKSPLNILDTYTGLGHGKSSAGRIICYTCHEYHGSLNDKLIKTAINGYAVLSNYSGNNVTVCLACHRQRAASIPMWPGYQAYSSSIHAYGNTTTGNLVGDGRHGLGVCVNCHNPHGSKVDGKKTGSMLGKNEENLCYTCHASGFDNFSTAGDYNNKWNRFGSVLTIKKENKALHFGLTGGQSIGQNVAVWDGLASSTGFPDKDSVITVRLKVPVYAFYAGSFQAGMRVEDSRNSSDSSASSTKYASVFYRMHSSPAAWICRFSGDTGAAGPSAFGDEATAYHTIKVVRRSVSGQFDAYVDNTLITTGTLATSGRFKVRLFCNIQGNTSATQEKIEAWFDDFNVSYSTDGSAHNTSSGDDVQARFYMKSHHKISDADQVDGSKVECSDCHDPHTITEKLMAYKETSGVGGKTVVPEEADQYFCLKCHSPAPPAGVKFPAGGVWDKSQYALSAHGNPLKRNRTFGNYSNGVSYACKVCHNPHGSDQAALQRESWDINRDGIPDDIDGDGVLDSTSMVGYIGYSTGSRKAMLVKSPRTGFKRISSTIPYQANGTIDVMLCLNCHDGSPAPDVKTDFDKLSHHDVTYADQQAHGGSKIECYSCHDQHRAQARDDAAGDYPTTNPDPPRAPMPGDAKFCLRCHDNTLPAGVSFGTLQLKNIKLSYNPYNLTDSNGYDLITSFFGHYVQSTGAPLMCRECHNQHGSSYAKLIRDDTEQGKPGYNSAEHIQGMQPVALRQSDPMGGGDTTPLSSTPERCLACHSGTATYKGALIPIPPPPDAAERGFSMSPVGRHPDSKPEVTFAGGYQAADSRGVPHIYSAAFAVITSPGSVKEDCTLCHDSHSPYIPTVDGQLMDCYRCHNANTSLPDVQTEFNDNPTNPARSKSMHQIKYDPTGTTPYYVECLKCHDQTKHMQGRVRLRKNPSSFVNYTSNSMVWTSQHTTNGAVDSTLSFTNSSTVNKFCLECHAPGTTVAASFWRGGTEHVPPRLPAGHLSAAHFINGGLVCTSCHEYHGSQNTSLKKNARGDDEAFCYSCHGNKSNSQNAVNVRFKFMSTAVHHQVAKADQAKSGGKVLCDDCHNPHVVTRTSPVVKADDKNTAAPSDKTFCISCHDSNGGPGVKFPGFTTGASAPEWDQNGKWNKWDKSAYAGSSHDQQGLECKKCHDVHGSPNYSMLLTNISSSANISVSFGVHSTLRGKRKEELGVNRVCSGCHKQSVGVYDGYANFTGLTFGGKHGIDKNCTYCHNAHGTSQPKLIRANKPLYMNMTSSKFGSVYNFKGFSNHTTGAPVYMFCSSVGCHASERSQFDTFNLDLPVDNFDHRDTSSSHHPLKEGVVACTSCHKEHGSSTKGTDYLTPDLRATFFRGSNWPNTWHAGRGVYSTNRRNESYIPANGCCTGSSDGSDYFEPPAAGRGQVTTMTPPDNANDLCFMCHQKDDIIGTTANGMAGTNTKFLGHEAVKGGAMMSHQISPSTAIPANGEYHNFSCSMCHFPHSSTQGKLLKTSCMSQADNQYPSNQAFNCHAFQKWATYQTYGGWRNLTTAKGDFKRPPNPVTDLSATKDPDLTVHLGWTAISDQSGQGANHYSIYRYSQAITQATKPNATRILKVLAGGGAGSAMSWADYTGQPNTTYYYMVVACDTEGNESFVSNSVSVSLGADTVAPNAISGQQTAQVDGTYNVKLTWHDPGDNVNVVQYKIYRKSGTTPLAGGDIIEANRIANVSDTSQSADGSPDANTYAYTDAVPTLGQSFSYAVVAVDAATPPNVSAVPTGSTFSVTIVDPAPAGVSTLSVKPVSLDTKAQLSWTAPTNVGNISGYNIYRKAGSALTQLDLVSGNMVAGAVSTLTYTDTVPSVGADYCYAVTAVDQSSGKESMIGNSAVVNLPVPPGGVAGTQLGNSCIQMSWAVPAYTTNLGYYKVYMRRNAGAWTAASPADNLVPFGSFENGMDSWTSNGLTATGEVGGGRDYVKLVGSPAGDKFIEYLNMVPVQPSTSYVYSGYVNVTTALTGGNTALRVIEYNASNGYVTEHVATGVTTTSGWLKLTDTWTTNATTTQVKLRVQLQGIGTAYWDDLKLAPSQVVTTSAKVDLTGLEPGSYDFCVTSSYSTYGGSTPYESVMSATTSATVTDTQATASVTPSAALLSPNYTQARVTWTSPSDANFTSYTPSGMGYYRVQASRDLDNSWATVFKGRLTNPSFESFSGTADDGVADSFTDWTGSNAYIYAVTDALFDGKAMKLKTAAAGAYVVSAEPDTGQTVAYKSYSFSFWAKANKPGVSFVYCIQANGGGWEQIGNTTGTAGAQWQRYTAYGAFPAGATAHSARVVIWASTDASAELTVDGVRLDTGTSALNADDGSYFQPSGYDTAGNTQNFDDPTALPAGTSARYRVLTVDGQGNVSGRFYTQPVYAKPTPINDLQVMSLTSTSGNLLTFSTPLTRAGLARYKVYAKAQATPLVTLAGATLIGTMTPTVTQGGNIAQTATASASATYSYPATNINDGNSGTYWDGMWGATPNSVTLTFGSAVPMYKVAFTFYQYNTGYTPKDYLIQTNDGSGWVTQVTVAGNATASPSYTFSKPVNASQVRIYITDTQYGLANYRPIIYEFMVYPGETFTHDLQNTALPAEAGRAYAYAVISEDVNNLASDISSGSPTVNTVPDKNPPDKVNDLAVTSAVGSTTAVLTWTTPLDNLGHGVTTGATNYEIYQLPTSSVGTPAPVTDDNFATATLVASGAYASSQAGTPNTYTATWYDHKGVYYAVRSKDSSNNWSKISNSPLVTVGKDIQAPTPPVITSCNPVTSPEVDVYFSPSVDNVGVNGYRLFRADTSLPAFSAGCITENNVDQAEVAVNLIPYSSASAADNGGIPGKTYYYALRAWDDDNNMSNISNCVAATVRTTGADTTPPTWGAAPLAAYQQPYPDIDLIWTAATDKTNAGGAGSIDHYDIYRGTASFSSTTDPGVVKLATVSGIRGSYVDNTGLPEGTYYYGVVASDASVNHNPSVLSNIASALVASKPTPDNTPPSIPGGLASATGVYPFINLSWTASADVDDASATQQILYYKLYRSDYPLDITDANKVNASMVTTFIMANDATSYVARGTGSAKYNFRIEAFDKAGNRSGLSAQVMGLVASAPCVDATAPSAPTNLAAVIGPSPDMDLSWTASTDSGICSGVIDHYLLYRANYAITAGTDLRTLAPIYISGNSAAYVDSTGVPNTQYWYAMTAVDSSGNQSGMSNIITKTTAADIMPPAAIADLKATPGSGSVLLTWCKPSDNVGVDHYEIYRKAQATILTDGEIVPANKVSNFSNTGACLSFNNSGVTSGTTYSYAVIAVDGAGNRSTISRGINSGDTIAAAQ